MRAMQLSAPRPVGDRPLELVEVDRPVPRPTDLLVRVRVCGVCRTDLHEVEGELELRRTPVIPGHEIVGTVEAVGDDVHSYSVGDRVGVAWLHETCGVCPHCAGGTENLCDHADFTGWTVHGGYAEFVTVPERFAYRIPTDLSDRDAAPLLCAGIIGYRALRLSAIKPGQRLGLYGFGGSAHIAIQVARHWGCDVYVFTRSPENRRLAAALGAAWVGGSKDEPPARLNSSIIFAPAGDLVRDALAVLQRGGTVALAGIYMSPVPSLDYRQHLYDEKVLRSVANCTRRDGQEFLEIAASIPVLTQTHVFPLDQANDALTALKHGKFSGAAVLEI